MCSDCETRLPEPNVNSIGFWRAGKSIQRRHSAVPRRLRRRAVAEQLGRAAKGYGHYQSFGDLLLVIHHQQPVSGYRRELDIATGVASVSYRAGDVAHQRQYFASYPDQVVVLRLTADRPIARGSGAPMRCWRDTRRITANSSGASLPNGVNIEDVPALDDFILGAELQGNQSGQLRNDTYRGTERRGRPHKLLCERHHVYRQG